MKENSGLKNAARYALQPNIWGFCGENDSQECLRNFVAGRNGDANEVRITLEEHGFPHLNAFLETIAKKTGRDRFDPETVITYWLGGDVIGDKRDLLDSYKRYFPSEMIASFEKVLPEKIYLTHLSQVILIASADSEGKEKTKLINHCMIAKGEIQIIDNDKREAVVWREFLDENYTVKMGKQTIKIDPDLTPYIEVGNKVAVHLGYLAATLTPAEAESLSQWTKKVADFI